MQFHSFLEFVPKIRELNLPGLAQQLKMAPPFRKQLIEQPIDNPKRAAVVCLFHEGIDHKTFFYLIRRSNYPGVHSNQIGFPGGQIDSTDKSPWDAAKRELEEEIGISANGVTLIKEITPLYIPPSRFLVDCFIGYTDGKTELMIDANEVQEVITVAVHEFLNANSGFSSQVGSNGVEVPIYTLSDNIVWGATAMMLAEIKSILSQVQN
jgi:8-oxo-dGTP pyrophosphatase MutT (NUDIX family)|tara:strand:+ start:1423 stop:2049 length:627 start_codon:yes stop_codon:yes gene_type:complete